MPSHSEDKVEINSFCPLVLPAITGIYLSGVIFVFRINDYAVGVGTDGNHSTEVTGKELNRFDSISRKFFFAREDDLQES